MSLEYFPKDTVILSAGRRASESLYIVQKGAVKLALRTQVGKELTLDMRSEGEVFGLLSLMGGDVARLDVTAIEDTLCYTVPSEEIQELIKRHTEVADYLFRTSVTRYMDRSLKELRSQVHLMGDTERLLYALAVKDVVRNPVVVCPEKTTIREAAIMAASGRATCLAVVGEDGRPVGIVTDQDFTYRVVARGLSAEQPVSAIMSAPVISVESTARVFQALLAMLNRDIHHVLVVEEGLPISVISSHDLALLQGKSPLSVARHIEEQKDVAGVAAAQQRVVELLPLLLREGAKASHITRVVAEINDRLAAKLLEFARAKIGAPPVPFCWVVLGSEGRREQTFKTDQDNALIYADVAEERSQEVSEYFAQLSVLMRDALVECGYPVCSGDYMASNPRWRQSLGTWQQYFTTWISEADLHSTEDALLFFDMRPAGGDASLFEALAAHTRAKLKGATFFKSVLGNISVKNRPPLGFFRTFVVERTGEHKEELDLKLLGTGPIVNAARLFALDAGLESTNTVDRLTGLQGLGVMDEDLLRDARESFEFLTLLRLEQQLQQSHAGQALSNYVRPQALSQLQRSLLKEAFHTVVRLQALVTEKFRSAVWQQLGN
jgi:CBS domain-containing protein